MVKATTRCYFRKIYPVRYAITSEEQPPIQVMGSKFDDTGPAVPGHLFTLRTLRKGFVHIYLEKTQERRTYQYANGNFVLGRVQNGLFGASGGAAKPWIEVERSESSILIAYSEVEWTEEFWAILLHNAKKRAERMQRILLDDAASGQHTALLETAPTLVEEFRQDPGFLNSMREQLQDIFDPDMEKSLETTPTRVEEFRQAPGFVNRIHEKLQDIFGLTESQVFSRWQHSDVPIGSPPSGIKNALLPPPWKPQWPPMLANALAVTCSTTPLLVAVHDPFGVSRDMGAIHVANLAAMAQYMAWNAHPLAVACHLHGIDKSIQLAMKDMLHEPPTPGEDLFDESSGINGGMLGTLDYTKLYILRRKAPEAGKGWKDFLDTQKNVEEKIKNAIYAHIEAWDTWLANDSRASLCLAFSDFEPVHQWEKREASFAECHMLFSTDPEHSKRKEVIYFSPGTQQQQLFDNILKDGAKVTENTDMLLLNFSTAIIEKSKADTAFFEQLADHVQKRMAEFCQKEVCVEPESMDNYFHTMEELAKAIAKEDSELLEMVTLTPPEIDNILTVRDTIKKTAKVSRLRKVQFVARYRPLHTYWKVIPREVRRAMLRLNGIGQVVTSLLAAQEAQETYDKTQSTANSVAVILASLSLAATCVGQGGLLCRSALASRVLFAASWFSASLLILQFVQEIHQYWKSEQYTKAINTSVIFGGGVLGIVGALFQRLGIGAVARVLSGWGLVVMLGGALLTYLWDHGPLGDWLEKCYWHKNKPLYSSDETEKFSYKMNQHERKEETLTLFLENLTEFYKFHCLPVLQQPYSESGSEFVVFPAAVNVFDVPSGRLELTPHMKVEILVHGEDIYNRSAITSYTYPVPFTWSKSQKELEILDSGGAICRFSIPRAEAEAACQKALPAEWESAYLGGNGCEVYNHTDNAVRYEVSRTWNPVWCATATYTDYNNIRCSAPERAFKFLVRKDKTG